MKSLAELDLPELPMEEPTFGADPLPRFAAARRQHPWLAKSSSGLVVHEVRAIRELFRMEDKMTTGFEGIVQLMGAKDTPWGRFTENQMLSYSGAAHKRIRDLLAPAFTPRQANLHRPLMREVITQLLDEWAPKGAFNFEEFASYFPITVMCKLIGASPDAIPNLRSSLEALGLGFSLNPEHSPGLQKAITVLDDFVQELVAERRRDKHPRSTPDLLDALLEANVSGGLTDRELCDLLIFLFVAGYDTSKNVLTFIMHVMLDRPDDYARCAADSEFCHKIVEETLRFHSPATSFRLTTADIEYRDVLLPKGSMLYFTLSVAGRDPNASEHPDEFRPERNDKSPHVAFGLGAHICLGQFIARAQIEEGLHLIAQRITKPRLAGPVGWRPFPGVWGIRGLPIAFEPTGA